MTSWRDQIFARYLTEDERLEFLAVLLRETELVKVTSQINACRDARDNKFLELAISGAADCIVSGDQDLLVRGDQRAKDLVDRAVEEPDPRRAIWLLNKALSYGQTGLYASSAYAELGGRYSALGDPAKAIECYTKSLELSPSTGAYVLFWRGQLYYEQEQWAEALVDFERALSIGLYAPDSDQVRAYVADIRARGSGQ